MPFARFNAFSLELTAQQASECSHGGRCDDEVTYWAPRIARPAECTPEALRRELTEWGAWDEQELADDAENWKRIVWIAAGCVNYNATVD